MLKMVQRTIFLGILLLSINVTSFSQVIMVERDRVAFIDKLRDVLHVESMKDDTMFSEIYSPFVRIVPDEPPPIEEPGEEVEEEAPTRLSDEKALELIARQFNPVGSLIFGDKGILQFSNGSRMKLGDSFNAQIRGEDYQVTITEIKTNAYTLSIGDASLKRRFLDDLNRSSRIERAPTSETPSGDETFETPNSQN